MTYDQIVQGLRDSQYELQNEGRLVREAADATPELPAYPRRENLIEFFVSSASDFRFFVDRASISVKGGVVRYTLVARSPSGVENVTYEAIRCPTAEYRVYYLGQSDRTWGGRPGGWGLIAQSRQIHYRPRDRDYFCPQSNPIRDAEEGRMALRQGGHPWAKGFSGDALLGR